MATALQIFQGPFGRAALLDMNRGLVDHAHPHCHVLLKISGRDGAFNVRGRTCPLTDDTMVLVNAWELHRYEHESSPEGTVILALYIEPAWLAGLDRAFGASAHPGFFPSPVVSVAPHVRALAAELSLALTRDCGPDDRLEILTELMLAVVMRHSGPGRPGATLAPSRWNAGDFRLRKAIGFMQENIGAQFTLDHVAREVGLSRAQLFRVFQNNISLTPKLYFNALRMEAAIRHLAGEEERLSCVSDRLGFSMQCHFTRFFRSNLGITPSEYRRVVRMASGMPVPPYAAAQAGQPRYLQ